MKEEKFYDKLSNWKILNISESMWIDLVICQNKKFVLLESSVKLTVNVNQKKFLKFGFKRISNWKITEFPNLNFWTILNQKYNLILKTKLLHGNKQKLFLRPLDMSIWLKTEKNTLLIKVKISGNIYIILIVKTPTKFAVIINSFFESFLECMPQFLLIYLFIIKKNQIRKLSQILKNTNPKLDCIPNDLVIYYLLIDY